MRVFGRVRLANGDAGYQVRVCGAARQIHAGAFDLRRRWDLRYLARADTVIIPRYPNASVDRNVLYIDNGRSLTAAGAAAGLDLCLHRLPDSGRRLLFTARFRRVVGTSPQAYRGAFRRGRSVRARN